MCVYKIKSDEALWSLTCFYLSGYRCRYWIQPMIRVLIRALSTHIEHRLLMKLFETYYNQPLCLESLLYLIFILSERY